MSELHVGDDTVLTVIAMNGQYRIEADPEQDEDWPTPVNALATGEDGWVAVLTGTQFGPVTVQVQILAAPPESYETGWEMVGERDLHCDEDVIRIRDLFSNIPPDTVTVRPGIYRLRIHVSSRAEASPFAVVEEPIERHLVQMWAVPEPRDPVVLVGPDEWGRNYMEQVAAAQASDPQLD
jgi:hypothetical protein